MAHKSPRLTTVALHAVSLLVWSCTGIAHGRPTSLHDIPWYMANNAARSATLNLCRSDHRFARDVDCANAEAAEDRLYSKRTDAASFGDDELVNPQYWASRRLVRKGVIASCQHPPTTYRPATCAAAMRGDALDPAGRP